MKKFEKINSNVFGELKQCEISNLNMILGGECKSTQWDACQNTTATDGTYTTAPVPPNRESKPDEDGIWVKVSPQPICVPKDTIG